MNAASCFALLDCVLEILGFVGLAGKNGGPESKFTFCLVEEGEGCPPPTSQGKVNRSAKSLWRWMKRRAAFEPGVGHLKREHRMDRNRFKGVEGDRLNAILNYAGMIFRKLLRWRQTF